MVRAVGFLAVFLISMGVFGREASVKLANYVADATAICICKVPVPPAMVDPLDVNLEPFKVDVEQTLKGTLGATAEVGGMTGMCVVSGPASNFMEPGKRYLLFLFKNNKVGRLGGILPIEGDILIVRYIDGFTGVALNKRAGTHELHLSKAIEQIKALLEKRTSSKPENSLDALPVE